MQMFVYSQISIEWRRGWSSENSPSLVRLRSKMIIITSFLIFGNEMLKWPLYDLIYIKTYLWLSRHTFNQDIALILSLVDALIKPTLLYASDFWGCFKLPRFDPIQSLYMSMKQILGVQKQTTNIGVLLELGKNPSL